MIAHRLSAGFRGLSHSGLPSRQAGPLHWSVGTDNLGSSLSAPLPELLAGMVTFGLGMGCAFVAGSVASLQNVRDTDSGVAAAVQNIAFTTGTTFGVAVFATIATATTAHLAPDGHPHLADLASGYRAALVGGALIAALGLTATINLRLPAGSAVLAD